MNTFIALILVGLVPALVIFLLPTEKSFFHKPLVRGFGLGVYTALIYMLMSESIEHGGIGQSALWFGIGVALSFIIGYIVKEFHHHHEHDKNNSHDHGHSKSSMVKILVSDFFHNIVDGISIIASFALSPAVGMTALVGVLGHQVIQQGGQQVLLVESGVSPKKAVLISLVVSLSVFLGFVFNNEVIEVAFIALSAGIVVWKVLTDMKHTRWTHATIVGFITGAVLLIGTLLLIPHAH
jgi:zinc transporter ZupT